VVCYARAERRFRVLVASVGVGTLMGRIDIVSPVRYGGRGTGIDAEVFVAPPFWLLLALTAAVAILQATLLRDVAFRGGHVRLLTVLIVWIGLRCGIVTGGWLGLIGGLLEDALGGGGVNVLGVTLIGFG